MPVLTLVWLGMCLVILTQYRRTPHKVLLGLLMLFVGGVIVKLFCFDMVGWGLMHEMLYGRHYVAVDGLMRLLDFGAIIAFLVMAYAALAGRMDARAARTLFGAASLVLLFIFSTLELNTLLYCYVRGLRSGGVSILWSVFALGLILGGIWRDVRALRYVGLGLFAVVAWKGFFVALALLDQVYRIVAFILLGVLVMCGSFIYLKYRNTFARKPDDSEGSEP